MDTKNVQRVLVAFLTALAGGGGSNRLQLPIAANEGTAAYLAFINALAQGVDPTVLPLMAADLPYFIELTQTAQEADFAQQQNLGQIITYLLELLATLGIEGGEFEPDT